VIEWMMVDDRQLPKRALRETRLFRSELVGATPDKPLVQRIGYIRRTFSPMEVGQLDPSHFAPPAPRTGDGVVDKRQRISYVVGGNRIVVNGHMFVLKDTIDGLIDADALPELLRTATEDRSYVK
jgi:hypothetical protein